MSPQSNGEIACTVKSKGFTLNYETGLILTMDTMKKMVSRFVCEGLCDTLTVESMGIRRTKEHNVVTRSVKKSFGVTANKRDLRGDYMTFPYGYIM